MPINIYSIANHLKEEGWQLVSTEYKNLDTELEMICPAGHKQSQTYRAWRKHPICEICFAGDTFKIKNKVPTKNVDTTRILALDAASNTTGYAIYDNGDLVNYGVYHAIGNNSDERINNVKKWLIAAIDEWTPDFVGLENIQLQSYGKSNFQVETYRVLANLQGVLIDTLFEACIDYDLAYAVEWRKYCGVGEGIGRENKKKQAQEKVKLWYNQNCTQDEADAICLGKYFVSILKKKTSWGENLDV